MTSGMYDRFAVFVCEAIESRPWLSNLLERMLEPSFRDET
jgi:hypothetical protein